MIHCIFNNRFLVGILLNASFVAVEIFYGIKANSIALIADAIHNAGDVCILLIAWLGNWMAKRKATYKFTYGFKNASFVAAFINSIFLFIAVGKISWEAIGRLWHQETVIFHIVICVASIGILVNGLTAYLFFYDRSSDMNIKSVFLNMSFDIAVSVGVVISGLLIMWKNIEWVDPVISLIIAAIILIAAYKLFKESLNFMLLAAPDSVDLEKLRKLMEQHYGLIDYHDLHIWSLSTTEIALSVHLVVKQSSFNDAFLKDLEKNIKLNFPISHITLQLELQNGPPLTSM